ncbi:multiprotein-bridging factor 1 [Dispira simplex]|nr:multiprotein-bridging factor 1 [Dispira simplex]
MSEQDWESVTVIRKSGARPKVARKEADVTKARRTGADIQTERKMQGGTNKSNAGLHYQQLAKIDYANDVVAPPKVKADTAQAIRKARAEKSLTQKELATKINEKPNVVQEYESGKAIPNQQVLTKMERALGVKLRGTNIGEPLGPRGKKK